MSVYSEALTECHAATMDALDVELVEMADLVEGIDAKEILIAEAMVLLQQAQAALAAAIAAQNSDPPNTTLRDQKMKESMDKTAQAVAKIKEALED